MELYLPDIWNLQAQKLITVREHPRPDVDLYIANYTPQVQFDKLWDKSPLLPLCRGLIFDGTGHVVARPFEKFFNLGEYTGPIPTDEWFSVTEKMDGSLGILYSEGDEPAIATRGSFASEQAIEGTRILREKYGHVRFMLRHTYLFEIIYPENRIVVDYGDRRDLVLLAIIDNETGKDVINWPLDADKFPQPKRYLTEDIEDLVNQVEPNQEGFVIRFESGLRLKVKGEEYLRLHKVMTGITPKAIWQALKNGDNIQAWLDMVPDEFADEIRATAQEFQSQFDRKAAAAKRIYDRIMESFEGFAYPDRKQFAMEAVKHPAKDILFLMYDEKPWADRIWKLIEPVGETT